MTGQHGPFLRITGDGLIVEATLDPATASDITDAEIRAGADLEPLSFRFDPHPRPYRWRDQFRAIIRGLARGR